MKSKSRKLSYGKYGYFFVLPFFIIFFMFQLYPMFYTVNLSFTDFFGFKTSYSYVGLANYLTLLNDKVFFLSIANTFIIWGVNFIPQIVLALFFAALFTSKNVKIRGKGFMKVIFYMPNIMTAATVAMIFQMMFYHRIGPVSNIVTQLGWISEDYQFLHDPWASRFIISFVQFWMWFGQTMIMMIAGMLSINPSLYEAGRIDGAGNGRMFFSITLPLLKPMMIYMLVTSMVGGLQSFDIPFLFNGGGPDHSTETMSVFIYFLAFKGQKNFNIAAAASVYLLMIAVTLSTIIFGVLNRKDKGAEA